MQDAHCCGLWLSAFVVPVSIPPNWDLVIHLHYLFHPHSDGDGADFSLLLQACQSLLANASDH